MKKMKIESYGSRVNPKLLKAWVPQVVHYNDSDQKCGLIFKGKLLK